MLAKTIDKKDILVDNIVSCMFKIIMEYLIRIDVYYHYLTHNVNI